MIFKEKPDNFNKQFDIVGTFLEYEGRFLLLRRHPHKAHGGKWGLPAGKKEENESIELAAIRELEEETGIKLPVSDINIFDSFYVKSDDLDFQWHIYSARLNTLPVVICNPLEHSGFCWVLPDEALKMSLIHDLAESIEIFYNKMRRN